MGLNPYKIKDFVTSDCPIMLEIGANTGKDTKRFLKSFKKLSLFCFEPDPRCIVEFKKRIADDRCTLFEVAVSDTEGVAMFYLSTGRKKGHCSPHINSSSLLKPTGHMDKFPWCAFDEEVSVKTITLDKWADEHLITDVDFIWADVQGSEHKLIKGAKEVLKHTKYFYTEFSDTALYEGQYNLHSILAMLPNFKIKTQYETDVLLENVDY